MWRQLFNRAGRASLSIVAAAVAQSVAGSPVALVVAPILSVLGKWMRQQGFQNVPF